MYAMLFFSISSSPSCVSLDPLWLIITFTSMAALTSSRRRHILFLVLIIALVEYHNNIRERCALLRPAILHPTRSPWRRLMDYGDASSFLLLTGITREAFYILHDILLPPRPEHLPKRRGRKWSLPPDVMIATMIKLMKYYFRIIKHRSYFLPPTFN